MANLIDRQAAIETLNKLARDNFTLADAFSFYLGALHDAADNIKQLPSTDAEPVRQTAEWIYGEKDGADGWYCSKCGFHVPWYYEYYGLNNINFIKDFHTCPHCDAKMLKYTGMEREQNG